jgi:hypothetical protein
MPPLYGPGGNYQQVKKFIYSFWGGGISLFTLFVYKRKKHTKTGYHQWKDEQSLIRSSMHTGSNKSFDEMD